MDRSPSSLASRHTLGPARTTQALPALAVNASAPPSSPPLSARLPLSLELPMAMAELSELLGSPLYYGHGVPRGDGHAVLLLPGFLGSDGYLTVLASWLERLGYQPVLLGGGVSIGSLTRLLQQVLARVDRLAAPGRRLTLIGHSLGGLLARLAAAARPDDITGVVSLGSPVTGDRQALHPLVAQLGRWLLWDEEAALGQVLTAPPTGVQLASIYSRQDAVVAWPACVDGQPGAVNIAVRGSHLGLPWNTAVYRELATLLAAPSR